MNFSDQLSDDDFIDLLAAFHEEIVGKREERWLISPAIWIQTNVKVQIGVSPILSTSEEFGLTSKMGN